MRHSSKTAELLVSRLIRSGNISGWCSRKVFQLDGIALHFCLSLHQKIHAYRLVALIRNRLWRVTGNMMWISHCVRCRTASQKTLEFILNVSERIHNSDSAAVGAWPALRKRTRRWLMENDVSYVLCVRILCMNVCRSYVVVCVCVCLPCVKVCDEM